MKFTFFLSTCLLFSINAHAFFEQADNQDINCDNARTVIKEKYQEKLKLGKKAKQLFYAYRYPEAKKAIADYDALHTATRHLVTSQFSQVSHCFSEQQQNKYGRFTGKAWADNICMNDLISAQNMRNGLNSLSPKARHKAIYRASKDVNSAVINCKAAQLKTDVTSKQITSIRQELKQIIVEYNYTPPVIDYDEIQALCESIHYEQNSWKIGNAETVKGFFNKWAKNAPSKTTTELFSTYYDDLKCNTAFSKLPLLVYMLRHSSDGALAGLIEAGYPVNRVYQTPNGTKLTLLDYGLKMKKLEQDKIARKRIHFNLSPLRQHHNAKFCRELSNHCSAAKTYPLPAL